MIPLRPFMDAGGFLYSLNIMEGLKMKNRRIAFIGAGSMAEAMISGLLQTKTLTTEQILVSNRKDQVKLSRLNELYGVEALTCKKSILQLADIIVLAMKPKDVLDGIQSIKAYIREDQLVISVIAGTTIDFIQGILGTKVPVVRAMPNTSSSIGYSATTITASSNAKCEHLTIAETIFQAIGTVTRVEEEELHVTTGLAGSGPAYIYYIAEGMEIAARELGLNREITRQLIAQTLLGAGQMLLQGDVDLSILRKNVTSPGGTTEAGINQLQNKHVQEAFMSCIKSAVERSKELAEISSNQQVKQSIK
jgi:pyrroline-5-carboxylate reductase